MDKYTALERFFGYKTFRPGQENLIDSIILGRDTLGVMPTGGGKSICFQIPALCLEGVTIVISPLVSLMKDQVSALLQNGIPAAFVNRTLSDETIRKTYRAALRGDYKIIYAAPERLSSRTFCEMCSMLKVSLVCVDEAHCVSQWGHDFRPSYLQIKDFILSFEKRPVVCAFTATATERVRKDIEKLLSLQRPFVSVMGFDRPNLYFEVRKPLNKYTELKRFLDLFAGKSGIIYCATRKKTDELFDVLSAEGYNITRYHAGLLKDERKRNQELFSDDIKDIVVATNAFGMGIDKSNVSFVIHYNMPGDLESYYQEAGRAGRDGSPAFCILLYSGEDIAVQRYFIDNAEENDELSRAERLIIRRNRLKKLGTMIEYCEQKNCLREFMLSYFGEKAPVRCENCSSCLGAIRSVDVTVQAQKVLSCVSRVKERENIGVVSSILRGEKNEYITEKGYDLLSTFGLLKEKSKEDTDEFITYLLKTGCLFEDDKKLLHLTAKARGILFRSVKIRRKAAAEKESGKTDFLLLSKLEELRKKIALKESIPPFTVFTDATLRAMAKVKPQSKEELAVIPGVSLLKAKKYGSAFLKLIAENIENGGK